MRRFSRSPRCGWPTRQQRFSVVPQTDRRFPLPPQLLLPFLPRLWSCFSLFLRTAALDLPGRCRKTPRAARFVNLVVTLSPLIYPRFVFSFLFWRHRYRQIVAGSRDRLRALSSRDSGSSSSVIKQRPRPPTRPMKVFFLGSLRFSEGLPA